MKRLVAVVAVALAGCSPDGRPRPVSLQLSADPVTLDPILSEDGVSMRVLSNAWDGLTAYDGEGKLVLRLAKAIEPSPDGLTWSVELREDAKWSDGAPLEAAHFVRGFVRARDPGTGAKLLSALEPIESVQALGPLKLRYRLKRSTSAFRDLLSLSILSPQRDDVLRANGGRWPVPGPSTGPYAIAESKTDRGVLLRRNLHSPYGKKAKIEEAEFLIVKEEATAAALFGSGRLDVVSRVADTEWARFREKGALRVDPFLATYYLAFRADRPPFDRKEARCLVAGAIDRAGLLRALGTPERPAIGFLPPELGGLAEGAPGRGSTGAWVQASKNSPLPFGIDAGARNKLVAEKVQADLAERIGLRVRIEALDWKSHVSRLRTDPPALYRFGWLSPIQDALPHLRAFLKGDPNALSRWESARYRKLVGEIERLPEGEKRRGKIREADRLLVLEECAVVPLFHYVQSHGVSPRLRGFRANPFGVVRIEELEN